MDVAAEPRLLIAVGEASGDAHAARVVRALRASRPWRVRGVAGPALAAAGVERVVDMSELSVIGFSGVITRLPSLWQAYRRMVDEAARFRPQAALLVDAPGFNFRLGPALHRLGIPIFYYVAPQVWAWHPERARQMRRWVDRMAVVFPFEEPIFTAAGVNTLFVGHPLLESLEPEVAPEALRSELGAREGSRMLGLLPGSRREEIRAHLPVMLTAAERLLATRPDLLVVLPLAPGVAPGDLERMGLGRLESSGGPGGHPLLVSPAGRARVLLGRTRAVQAAATACAVASGTATLETAVFGTPLAIVYRVGWLNYIIARRLVRLKHIGLPNIVAGGSVAPELIQGDFTAERLAATLAPWLDDAGQRARARDLLRVVRERLGEPGAASRVATALDGLVP